VLGVIGNNLIGTRMERVAHERERSRRQNIFFQNGNADLSPPRGRGICWLSSSPAFDLSQSVLAERDRGGPVAGRRR
jgi:hypothetical protein